MSNNTYIPNRWVIVEIVVSASTVIRKVLAGWSGGYLDADNWRMSSGITKVVEHDDRYDVHNQSGSTYTCFKSAVGVTSLSGSILNNLSNQADERGDVSIKIIDIKDLIENDNINTN